MYCLGASNFVVSEIGIAYHCHVFTRTRLNKESVVSKEKILKVSANQKQKIAHGSHFFLPDQDKMNSLLSTSHSSFVQR
jgi:hypothetical protein